MYLGKYRPWHLNLHLASSGRLSRPLDSRDERPSGGHHECTLPKTNTPERRREVGNAFATVVALILFPPSHIHSPDTAVQRRNIIVGQRQVPKTSTEKLNNGSKTGSKPTHKFCNRDRMTQVRCSCNNAISVAYGDEVPSRQVPVIVASGTWTDCRRSLVISTLSVLYHTTMAGCPSPVLC
jgi:hypothetical protein